MNVLRESKRNLVYPVTKDRAICARFRDAIVKNNFRPPLSVGGGDEWSLNNAPEAHGRGGARIAVARKLHRNQRRGSAMAQYPIVRQFPLAETTPSTGDRIRIVDVAQALSQANRRMYRYGRQYEVKIDLDANSNTSFEVFALRNDWAVVKAFQMAHSMYLKNTEDERANLSQDQVARWEDFRIESGVTGASVGPQFNFPGVAALNLVNQGEFVFSKVVDASNTRRRFTWGSGSSTRYGVLEEYDKVAHSQNSPSTVTSDAPYVDIETDVNEFTHDDLQIDGNEPPYESTSINQSAPFVKIATLDSSNPNSQKLSTGYFTVPCGLVLVVQTVYSDIAGKYSLTAKAGSYKGVHAPSMLE